MILEIENLSKRYEEFYALKDINIKLKPGVYGLLGANGAGKSTLFQIICGVKNHDSGNIYYNSKKIDPKYEYFRSFLGFLPQHFSYYPDFSGLDFMMYMSSLKGMKSSESKMNCINLLELVGLSDVYNKKIKNYSGGMKQRLGIAQSLINNPKILILDEPTVGLDPKERVRFRNLISSLSNDKIVILSTHIVSDIEYIADEIIIIKDGQIINRGISDKLIEEINNKVWEVHVSGNELPTYLERYIISNQRHEGSGSILRIISTNKPNISAVSVNPNLEDLYLYYFRGESRI